MGRPLQKDLKSCVRNDRNPPSGLILHQDADEAASLVVMSGGPGRWEHHGKSSVLLLFRFFHDILIAILDCWRLEGKA